MAMLEKVDERQKSSFWYSFATNYVFSNNSEISPISAEDNLFLKQAKVIEDLYNILEDVQTILSKISRMSLNYLSILRIWNLK